VTFYKIIFFAHVKEAPLILVGSQRGLVDCQIQYSNKMHLSDEISFHFAKKKKGEWKWRLRKSDLDKSSAAK